MFAITRRRVRSRVQPTLRQRQFGGRQQPVPEPLVPAVARSGWCGISSSPPSVRMSMGWPLIRTWLVHLDPLAPAVAEVDPAPRASAACAGCRRTSASTSSALAGSSQSKITRPVQIDGDVHPGVGEPPLDQLDGRQLGLPRLPRHDRDLRARAGTGMRPRPSPGRRRAISVLSRGVSMGFAR